MPRGIRSMDSIKNIDAQLLKLDRKITSVQSELSALEEQKSILLEKKKEIVRNELVDKIIASGKSFEDIQRALEA